MKQNIQTIPNALEQVCRLRGCTFEWASPHPQAGMPAVGMIAQELLEQIPECVLRDPRTDLHADQGAWYGDAPCPRELQSAGPLPGGVRQVPALRMRTVAAHPGRPSVFAQATEAPRTPPRLVVEHDPREHVPIR